MDNVFLFPVQLPCKRRRLRLVMLSAIVREITSVQTLVPLL